MAELANFYSGGPYLHNLPGYSVRDRFKANVGDGSLMYTPDDSTRQLESALRNLDGVIAAAEAKELQFYALFGVTSRVEWEEKFLGKAEYNKRGRFVGRTGTNLYNKTLRAIDDITVYRILSGESQKSPAIIQQATRFLNERLLLVGREALSTTIQSTSIKKLVGAMLKGSFAQHLNKGLKYGKNKIMNIKQVGDSGSEDILINNVLKAASQYVVDNPRMNSSELEEKLKVLLTKHFFDPERLIAESISVIGANLRSTLTFEDFYQAGYGEENEDEANRLAYKKWQRNYIERVFRYVKKRFSVALKGNFNTAASGIIGEASAIFTLTFFQDLQAGNIQDAIRNIVLNIEKDIKVIDTAYVSSKRYRTDTVGQAPVDITILEKRDRILHNLQVKGSFSRTGKGVRGLGGNIPLSSPSSLENFLDDLSQRGLMKGMNLEFLEYQLVNHFFRRAHQKGSGDFLVKFADFLALVTEHFIKSAYTTGLTTLVKDSVFGAAGETMLENHFILRPSVGLLPISVFLRAARNRLSAQGNGQQDRIFTTGFSEIKRVLTTETGGSYIDSEMLRDSKLAILGRRPAGEKHVYPEDLLTIGKIAGGTIMRNTPAPSMSISISAMANEIDILWGRLMGS